uniref:Uncharacterized protein n=1 Tax=Panagrolaimus davidi TaxID=227884 RepID=A0A914PFI7_9BILA
MKAEAEAETDTSNDNSIIYVCVERKDVEEKYCDCEENSVICSSWLKDANIKPLKENFVVKEAFLQLNNIPILQKGKIFPDNENTIEKLNLYWNDITQIENEAFDKFTSLNTLDLHGNKLSVINDNVFSVQLGKTLTTLNLGYNEITAIDTSIFRNLINLEHLTLYRNKQADGKIGKFPASLKKLKVLDLSYCDLTNIDDQIFVNLQNLETLKLTRNKFSSIPSAIGQLSNLKTFEFGGSLIQTITKNSFEGNSKLEYFIAPLSTKLESINDCAFCNLPNLKTVNFWLSTKLSFIHENAFGAISDGYPPKVIVFSIESCNVTILPEKLLNWKKVQLLAIGNNPYACNCSMAWLFKDLLSDNSIYEKRLISGYDVFRETKHHHKYTLGCLGSPPTSPNHTHPYSVIEIFKPCKLASSSNFFWYFFMGILFIAFIVSIGIFANRSKLIQPLSFINLNVPQSF